MNLSIFADKLHVTFIIEMQRKNCKFSPIEGTNSELDTEKWFIAPSNLILTFAVICQQFILFILSHFGQEIDRFSRCHKLATSLVSLMFVHFFIVLSFHHYFAISSLIHFIICAHMYVRLKCITVCT